ncbi:MAG: hypothetical protein GQ527_11015 [Bacteroidales bacterium]|nr:hypothetical protein [Bacteroidales bacterium]
MDVSFYLANYLQLRFESASKHIELYIVDGLKKNIAEVMIKDDGVKMDTSDDSKSESIYDSLSNISEQFNGQIKQLFHKGETTLTMEWPLDNGEKPELGNFYSLFAMLMISNPETHIIFSYISKKGEYVLDSNKITTNFSKEELFQKETLNYLNEILKSHLDDVRHFL